MLPLKRKKKYIYKKTYTSFILKMYNNKQCTLILVLTIYTIVLLYTFLSSGEKTTKH